MRTLRLSYVSLIAQVGKRGQGNSGGRFENCEWGSPHGPPAYGAISSSGPERGRARRGCLSEGIGIQMTVPDPRSRVAEDQTV